MFAVIREVGMSRLGKGDIIYTNSFSVDFMEGIYLEENVFMVSFL